MFFVGFEHIKQQQQEEDEKDAQRKKREYAHTCNGAQVIDEFHMWSCNGLFG